MFKIKVFCFCCFLTAACPLSAASNRELRRLLTDGAAQIHAQIKAVPSLPEELARFRPEAVVLSSQNTGAAAEYRPGKKQILFFRKPLERWLEQPDVSALDAPARAALLARCLAPVYIHEISHARDQKWGETNGFFWPITLKDEFIASFWQLYVMRHYSLLQPDYYKACRPLLPANIPAPENWEEYIYRRYAAQKGAALPPPPLTPAHIEQLRTRGFVSFYNKKFFPPKKKLSFKRFIRQPASWLQIKKRDIPAFINSRQYINYLWLDGKREQEIKK